MGCTSTILHALQGILAIPQVLCASVLLFFSYRPGPLRRRDGPQMHRKGASAAEENLGRTSKPVGFLIGKARLMHPLLSISLVQCLTSGLN